MRMSESRFGTQRDLFNLISKSYSQYYKINDDYFDSSNFKDFVESLSFNVRCMMSGDYDFDYVNKVFIRNIKDELLKEIKYAISEKVAHQRYKELEKELIPFFKKYLNIYKIRDFTDEQLLGQLFFRFESQFGDPFERWNKSRYLKDRVDYTKNYELKNKIFNKSMEKLFHNKLKMETIKDFTSFLNDFNKILNHYLGFIDQEVYKIYDNLFSDIMKYSLPQFKHKQKLYDDKKHHIHLGKHELKPLNPILKGWKSMKNGTQELLDVSFHLKEPDATIIQQLAAYNTLDIQFAEKYHKMFNHLCDHYEISQAQRTQLYAKTILKTFDNPSENLLNIAPKTTRKIIDEERAEQSLAMTQTSLTLFSKKSSEPKIYETRKRKQITNSS